MVGNDAGGILILRVSLFGPDVHRLSIQEVAWVGTDAGVGKFPYHKIV